MKGLKRELVGQGAWRSRVFFFSGHTRRARRLIVGARVVNARLADFVGTCRTYRPPSPSCSRPRSRSGPCRSVSRRSISFRSVPPCYATSRILTSSCITLRRISLDTHTAVVVRFSTCSPSPSPPPTFPVPVRPSRHSPAPLRSQPYART